MVLFIFDSPQINYLILHAVSLQLKELRRSVTTQAKSLESSLRKNIVIIESPKSNRELTTLFSPRFSQQCRLDLLLGIFSYLKGYSSGQSHFSEINAKLAARKTNLSLILLKNV